MKSLLFAAFALSLILIVSAQCDPDTILTCTLNYTRTVRKLDLQLCVRAYSYSCDSLYDNTCITSSIPLIFITRKFFTNHNCHAAIICELYSFIAEENMNW